MSSHLVKVTLFLLVQVGIFAALHRLGGSESAEPAIAASTSNTPSNATPAPAPADVDARLAAFVREQVRPMWEADPGVIDDALAAGSHQGLIEAVVRKFIVGPDNYLVAADDKRQRLCTAAGRRLILLGGSNVAFSIDSLLLEQRYGVVPVNMGLKAGLGSKFMTRQVADQIHDGDVVVILLEHIAMFAGPDASDRLRTAFCKTCPDQAVFFEDASTDEDAESPADQGWQAIKHFADREALADLAATCRTDAKQTWSRVNASFKGDVRGRDIDFDEQVEPLIAAARRRLADLDRVYVRSGFNEYGDMTRHRGEPPAERGEIFGLGIGFRPDAEPRIRENIAVLNEFAAECEARGATMYFAHPPLPRTKKTIAFAGRYEAILEDGLAFPILYPIEQSFVEIDEMYDSCYHLNWQGITRRMTLLCEGLDRHLAPQTDKSIAELIAARDRAVRGTAVATRPDSTRRVQ